MATKQVDLSCTLCSSPFSDPRLLPCLHVYCKCCLESLVSQNEAGTLTCPSCYKITPDCTPSQLPKHLKVEREVSASELEQSDERLCGSCDDNNKAEAYCQDCISPLCSECVASHKRLKLLKSHILVSLDILPSISCPLHPKECFKYYCLTCSRLICADCIVDHAQHRYVSVDKAASSEMKYLRDSMSKVEDLQPFVNQAIKKISSIVKVVRENKVKSQEKLDRTFEEISTAIKSRYDQLSKELEDIAIAKTTQLEMQKEDLEKITASLELALSMGNDVCTTYSKIEALSVKQSVVHALKNVLDHINPTSFHPVCIGGPEVSINHSAASVENFVLSIAKIRSMSQYPPLCSLVDVDPELIIGVARNSNCLFTLQTRNSRGEDLKEGGATVKATVKNISAGKQFKCKVNDLQNGKYEILFASAPSFFRPDDDVGELHITVDGTAIQDSPFDIDFINYNRAISPSETFTINDAPEYLDSAGNLLYITTNQGYILVYENDTDNTDLKITNIILNSGGISNLRGIAVDQKNGVMFFAGANKVIKADLNGNVIATIGDRGTDKLEFNRPTGVCLTKEGLLLISDFANRRVQVLNSDMSFNQFIPCSNPVWGVAVDPGNNIHVGTTDCVEVFDINGGEITEYGQQHLYKAGDIQFPNFQQPSDCKYSFVTECVDNGEIFFFNWKTDTVLHRIKTGSHPLGLRIDQSGDMTVCCFEDNEIQMFIW